MKVLLLGGLLSASALSLMGCLGKEEAPTDSSPSDTESVVDEETGVTGGTGTETSLDTDTGCLLHTWFVDADDDGWGAGAGVQSCEPPEGDDVWVLSSGDCDDGDAEVNPDASEICDGLDNDCDGRVDPNDADGSRDWYRDADSDGYGGDESQPGCEPLSDQYVAETGDCDDLDSSTYPGAAETCDADDNDCDGVVDEGAGGEWYLDMDGDGYGDTAAEECFAADGYVNLGDDCDDTDAATHPDAPEAVDGDDQDCDGIIDEDTRISDDDGDGLTEDDGDCNDADSSAYPGADEMCDEVDDDCDGVVDEVPVDGTVWYLDSDGDGAGEDDVMVIECDRPAGYSVRSDDCDDEDYEVNPLWVETCDDGVDNNCNGLIDCEEGSCGGVAGCSELDCADGEDEDEDGYTDCADDDCWGTAACGASVVVTGGQMTVRLEERVGIGDFLYHSVVVSDVTGVQRVSTGSGGVTSCEWSLEYAQLSYAYDAIREVGLARSGFATECPELSLWDLPTTFQRVDAGVLLESGGFWYHGDIASSTTYGTTSYRRTTWHIPMLSTGEPWVLE